MIAVGAVLQGSEIKGAQIFGLGMLQLTRLALDYLVRKFTLFSLPSYAHRDHLSL